MCFKLLVKESALFTFRYIYAHEYKCELVYVVDGSPATDHHSRYPPQR